MLIKINISFHRYVSSSKSVVKFHIDRASSNRELKKKKQIPRVPLQAGKGEEIIDRFF